MFLCVYIMCVAWELCLGTGSALSINAVLGRAIYNLPLYVVQCTMGGIQVSVHVCPFSHLLL